ncbi:MAG: ParB/RepB/Spo0J family partition protein [Bacilli bacterium]|jgi:ParB family chromosome partitioning protein|nr:ParB/RepB/Spo0J family partition protein [Bacilli bacterium]
MNMEKDIQMIPIEDIIPNRFQPRLAFDESGLKELSESIKQHGIIQPLVLRRLGEKYEIIAGERRYKAATMAGLNTVPAIISNIDDNQSAEVALVENIQRRNLTAIEEAKSYKSLLDRGYLTQEQLAEKMGVSQSSIANKLRLLNLDEEVQNALLNERISERHARALLSLTKEEQKKWLKRIIDKRMTVRQLDMELKKMKDENDSENIPLVSLTPNLESIVNNATDINPIRDLHDVESMLKPMEEKKEEQPLKDEPTTIPNKFFNFLEDEAANMNMTDGLITKEPEPINPLVENIEVLDDGLEEERKPVITTENPFLLETTNNEVNTIEEVKETVEENIFDPVDSILKLDPNYEQNLEEENGTDLKTAINTVRNLVNQLNNNGFQIEIEELDLNDNYEMHLKIKK